MKNRNLLKRMPLMCLLSVVMVGFGFIATPMDAQAVVNCTTVTSQSPDSDGDGYMDYDECNGAQSLGPTPVSIPSCWPTVPVDATYGCFNPDVKDLFFFVTMDTVVTPAGTLSLLPTTNMLDLSGLGITVHQIPQSAVSPTQSGALFVGTQKAIEIREYPRPGSGNGVLGEMPQNSMTTAKIYTGDIRKYVLGVYGVTTYPSTTSDAYSGTWIPYIKYVLAHEVGHGLNLRQLPDAKLQNHYSNSTSLVMQQTAVVSTQKKTFFFPTAWKTEDRAYVDFR